MVSIVDQPVNARVAYVWAIPSPTPTTVVAPVIPTVGKAVWPQRLVIPSPVVVEPVYPARQGRVMEKQWGPIVKMDPIAIQANVLDSRTGIRCARMIARALKIAPVE